MSKNTPAYSDSERKKVRHAEFVMQRHLFKPSMAILELGGGSGYQASLAHDLGCNVLSIDIPEREPCDKEDYPVQDYNGKSIPAPSASFDLVFSSNVLEHVSALPELLSEIHRVTKPAGMILHWLPSPTWRFWHTMTHPMNVFRSISRKTTSRRNASSDAAHAPQGALNQHTKPALMQRLRWCLFGGFNPHGEFPNAFVELHRFRRSKWKRIFEDAGFEIITIDSNRIFYTGYFFTRIPIRLRKVLSRCLGSSCNVFVMVPRQYGQN
ncbi:MAG: methyltransferase domain-containing protein [Verrucomicrobiota bacterium]